MRWVAEQGVDSERFSAMYDAFSVVAQAARAEQLARAQRVPGVPTLVIDGRFVVSIASNRPFDVQLENVDLLIDEARRAKAAEATDAGLPAR